jgi:hypothetical protein
MSEKKEVVGYYTEDGNIYCVGYINKDREIMEKIEKVIRAKDSKENLYFCDRCEKKSNEPLPRLMNFRSFGSLISPSPSYLFDASLILF